MDVITVLGTLMGVSFASGFRLYSTVLVIGLGIRLGYLTVPQHLDQLRVLAETPILVIAGVAYAIEFIADKIPLVDTLWDGIHTFIRPIGAALLAATAIGSVDPVVKVGAVLLCGGIALSSHSAKAGTRVLVNHSPEPFSNIALSLAEDAATPVAVWLAIAHPIVTLLLVTIAVAITIWLIPRLIRIVVSQVRRLGAA